MRLGVLGEVARPGYFGFASDLPLTELIMGAGGPTAAADLERSIVRRGNRVYRSAEETRKAIGRGLTLDQFGLNAGDELVVGRRRDVNPTPIIGLLGALASVAAVFVALHGR
jgi:protein involved in polysaccharide export with SLBB domain